MLTQHQLEVIGMSLHVGLFFMKPLAGALFDSGGDAQHNSTQLNTAPLAALPFFSHITVNGTALYRCCHDLIAGCCVWRCRVCNDCYHLSWCLSLQRRVFGSCEKHNSGSYFLSLSNVFNCRLCVVNGISFCGLCDFALPHLCVVK